MKKILCLILLAILVPLVICSCSEKASDISAEAFEKDVIDRIPIQGKFKKSENNNTAVYTCGDLKYSVESSDDGYIKSVTVTVTGTDNEYLRRLNVQKINNIDSDLYESQKQSINAVKYCAMALTLLCDLQDEDSIDTVLDARTREISEGGWKLSFDNDDNKTVFRAVYE